MIRTFDMTFKRHSSLRTMKLKNCISFGYITHVDRAEIVFNDGSLLSVAKWSECDARFDKAFLMIQEMNNKQQQQEQNSGNI